MSTFPKRPSDFRDMISLKVDNLTYRTTVDDLNRVFSKYGKVADIYIPRDCRNASRGFAFVRFTSKKHAQEAIDALDQASLDGRNLRVAIAKYDRPDYDARAIRRYRESRRYSRDRSRSRSYSYDRDRERDRYRRRRRRRSSSSRSRSRERYSRYSRERDSRSSSRSRRR